MSYYDLDSILTDGQKVPTTIELEVPGLGYLDNAPGRPLKAGTKVDLPLWLSQMLAVSAYSTKHIADLEPPSCLAPRVMNALKADPKSVDIRALSSHFYEFAVRILELLDEVLVYQDACAVLMETWRRRAAEISDHASNAGQNRGGGGMGSTDGVEFLRGLDDSERYLFRAAHDGTKAMRSWMGEMTKK
ncbi:hypothetical protein BJ878DRAFT_419472 [Calycina marina]|uniref:DNA replication complex GINS protein PSF3 n=1 Tax=Calycina marina TaxID=1763456 RepID=A0A9P7Z4N0_9HELO|nr:hypothetical protein BJ878DRAFT_419472 [Calycina marina]